jgi:sterol desaturase/sphingolipid hydroxylase (fatty acid hydroxylase superfamily)
LNYIVLAIPVFLLLIVGELVITRIQEKDYYRLIDSISDLGCGILGVDFLYYWFHRTSHEVNAFWAAHVVHHQSEEFSLAVALRQGAF